MTLVQDAQRDGARLAKACQVMGINVRTYYRWVSEGEVTADRRPDADRPEPANKLSPEEREAVLALCNAPEYRSRPPAFIVADQADKGRYLASESTMYRVLHEYDQQHHRGRQQAPQRKRPPTTHQATAPNRLWCCDLAMVHLTAVYYILEMSIVTGQDQYCFCLLLLFLLLILLLLLVNAWVE
ncbi:hypothetical protein HHSLTHF2_34780 [Vreelandella venusta]|uniref:Uncharacterized protein n=1 Tax=Halomonas hydrothermalis TaxID=115561 RepID=A0A6F8U7R3_9GAMM|nr:hypothetical protein HHSLTHF2_34780 [Halomonas hydrothermalis]